MLYPLLPPLISGAVNSADKILMVILPNLTFLIDPQTLQPLLAVRLMVVTLKSFTLANLSKFSLIFSGPFFIPLKIGLIFIVIFISSFFFYCFCAFFHIFKNWIKFYCHVYSFFLIV